MATAIFTALLDVVGSKIVSAPLERAKILIQVAPELKEPLPERRDLATALAFIVAREGILGLYRGVTTQVIRYFPSQALNFATKDTVKRCFAVDRRASPLKRFVANILSGSVAGAVSLFVVYPLDVVATRLMADVANSAGERAYTGILDCFVKTIQKDGVLALYAGFFPSIVGIIVYRGFYFGLYDTFRPLLPKKANFLLQFLFAQGVTIASGTATYPFDTVRRRLCLSPSAYSGAVDCALSIVAKEGIRGLFAGNGVNTVRAVVAALTLVVLDSVKQRSKK